MSDIVISARDTAVNKIGHCSAGTRVLIFLGNKEISAIFKGGKKIKQERE